MTLLLDNQDLNSVFFINEKEGFVSNNNSVFKTTDGGNSWSNVLQHSNFTSSSNFYYYSSTRIFKVEEGVIYMSQDNGFEWSVAFNKEGIEGFDLIDNNNGFMIFKGDLYSFTITDTTINKSFSSVPGLSWTVIPSYVKFANKDIGYVYDDFNDDFYRTTDGGVTWEQVFGSSYPVLYLVKMSFKGNTGISVGYRGGISYSLDGLNWNELSTNAGDINYLDAQVIDDNTFFVCGFNSFIRIIGEKSEEFFTPEGASLIVKKINFINKDKGYAIDVAGDLYKIELK